MSSNKNSYSHNVDNSEDQTNAFIELVKEHPILYDKRHPNYMKNVIKSKLWSEIAVKSGLKNGIIARKRFNYLSRKYKKFIGRAVKDESYNNIGMEQEMEANSMDDDAEESGQFDENDNVPAYINAMGFMADVISEPSFNGPSNSTKVNGNDDTITEMSNYIIDEGHSRAHHFSTRATSTKKTVAQIKVENAKRLMRENSTKKNVATIVEVGTYKERVREKESLQSANELFGLSVGKEIDNLHPQQQALVRMKIQQIFYNLQCPEVYNESEENDSNFQTI